MKLTPLPLGGAYRIDLDLRRDERGFFARAWCAETFRSHGLNTRWSQMNLSFTARTGTVRGMHCQRPPKAEIKIVRCIRGAVFDVLVDVRRSSPTYGRWTGVELTAESRCELGAT